MHKATEYLEQCSDVGSLELAIRTLCAEFGSVSRLDILAMTEAGRRQAVCLLRMESSRREQELMKKLGAERFGEDLCVVVGLKADQAPTRASGDMTGKM